ncbi:amidase [Alicyclobacillus tolerans]|uniref:amidase n=1 Tax=Alicyclobacillus tolerans TaxID=90970 RepID=UPI001F4220A7|nr:amidase [Alicyclobacillus tolerans]MCF8563169.1 amidase [Alicyclobacillus tolerans]
METKQDNHPLEWSLMDLAKKIQDKEVSCVEMTRISLDHIKKTNPEINAFITIMEESALDAARQAQREVMDGKIRSPLHGVPIALKDLIDVTGVPASCGSEVYKDYVPSVDAEIVTRLQNAGAIIVGKLNMHEFAYGTTGDRSYFGAVRNPHNANKITGGSSSGSGAAVANHSVFAAIGSDTGGSIRIPASCCGIVGMKPTFGLVSKHGAKALSWSLDHLGPMTRTVKDNAAMLNSLAGYDEKDPYSVRLAHPDYMDGIDLGIEGRTIGIPTSFYLDVIDNSVASLFKQAVQLMEKQGAKIVGVDLPHMNELLAAQQTILAAEAYCALEKEVQEEPGKIHPEVRERILSGRSIEASEYIRMLQVKRLATNMFLDAFDRVDSIMTPTLCVGPADIGTREIELNGTQYLYPKLLNRLTGPSNTTGMPAISVPGGDLPDGMPMGVQFIGKPFNESMLYRVAYALEQAVLGSE